jgi:hypothetical protein
MNRYYTTRISYSACSQRMKPMGQGKITKGTTSELKFPINQLQGIDSL